MRRAKVDVGRVQEVGLPRQRSIGVEGLDAIVEGPVRQAPDQLKLVDVRALDGQGQVIDGPPRGPGPGGRGRQPRDPSISIFTRRLNSMAYSIGSSLVKTSRKPWTMRFWASFSVRPRLIR